MHTIVIGGNTFTVSPLSAIKAFSLQPKLTPIVFEIMAIAQQIMSAGSVNLLEADISTLSPAISRITDKLGPDDLEMLVRSLLSNTLMDNLPLFTPNGNPFDVKMQGRMSDVWKLLWFAIKVNYPDFFKLLSEKGEAQEQESPLDKSSI